MIVDKAFMSELKKEAKAICGGTKHVFEVQTWGGLIDIDGVDLDDHDDIDHIPLSIGTNLPDNAKQIDIAVWGMTSTFPEPDRIANVQISIEGGKLAGVWS